MVTLTEDDGRAGGVLKADFMDDVICESVNAPLVIKHFIYFVLFAFVCLKKQIFNIKS